MTVSQMGAGGTDLCFGMSAGYNHASRGRININLEIKEVSGILAEKQSVMLHSKNFVATQESRVIDRRHFPGTGCI